MTCYNEKWCGVYRKVLYALILRLQWHYKLHGNRVATYQDQSRVQVEIVGHNDSPHQTQALQGREMESQVTNV